MVGLQSIAGITRSLRAGRSGQDNHAGDSQARISQRELARMVSYACYQSVEPGRLAPRGSTSHEIIRHGSLGQPENPVAVSGLSRSHFDFVATAGFSRWVGGTGDRNLDL